MTEKNKELPKLNNSIGQEINDALAADKTLLKIYVTPAIITAQKTPAQLEEERKQQLVADKFIVKL